MRALLIEEKLDDEVIVEGPEFLHLSKVVRLKKDSEILILNGEGSTFLSRIVEINKKNIVIKLGPEIKVTKEYNLSLYCCLVKKDALSEIIKKAVELGVSSLSFIESTYSQRYDLNQDRISSLIKSAMEQSNNPFKMHFTTTLISFEKALEEACAYENKFAMHKKLEKNPSYPSHLKNTCLFIGPEGGYSEDELNDFIAKDFNFISLPSPILRAPTALCTGVGLLLGKILD